MELSKLIRCLLKSEFKYFSRGSTKILVFARTSGSLLDLQLLLHKCGHVISFYYRDLRGKDTTLIEVTYAYATQALLALAILDGMPFGSHFVRVEIKETAKESMILHDLPHQLKKIIGRVDFPFKGI